ncbi:MAG: efflux RND transporter periplasmic adaptor subunit [Nitrospira sp.]|uniref:HlyD_D23 domain-containing protein n=1 Tax=Nitrospira defluvii TaxID=330214 RepID=A0ABM8QIA0_9BACT|nr:efflux RND transporter periplasmic adaptor subunit [Nitrospira defluvii]MCS6326685.1 efflux RND transporter periplasmic adaptor subunit [Nitrospira sp.]CAE6698527.1 HlyD_D23 domain-containing protein [Nitrospira defluvii]
MSGNPITRHPIVTLGLIVFVAVAALVVFRLTSGAKTDPRKNRILTVGTMTPLKQDLDVRLTYTADLIPNQLVNIFSRVDGYIAKIYVDKGDLVKANQLLVEIDHTDYVHAVNQAKANLLSAQAKVVQQDAGVRNATLTLDRMQALIKDQFVSQQDLDTALVNRDAAVALQDSLRAQVQQMTVALAQAETNLAYSYIRAPFAGYIAERNLDPGAYVSGTTASTSTVSRGILSVHDVETVRTLIEVVEKDVPLVQVGQRADVRAEAYPNEVFEGRVTRIVQALNRATRTMTVEVDLPNKDHRLKGGMFARVEVLVGKHPHAIQIPLDAVSRLEESQYVYVVKDGKAHQVPVELGARAENRVEVVKGLAGDEQLIVSGKDLVSEGVPVQVQPMDAVKRESNS